MERKGIHNRYGGLKRKGTIRKFKNLKGQIMFPNPHISNSEAFEQAFAPKSKKVGFFKSLWNSFCLYIEILAIIFKK